MLQKRVIQVINKSGHYDHTEPLFLRFDMLKLVEIKCKQMKFVVFFFFKNNAN